METSSLPAVKDDWKRRTLSVLSTASRKIQHAHFSDTAENGARLLSRYYLPTSPSIRVMALSGRSCSLSFVRFMLETKLLEDKISRVIKWRRIGYPFRGDAPALIVLQEAKILLEYRCRGLVTGKILY